ncbi:MAG: serine hydrolase, partial [Steroidobacteraceae bacterium]
MNPRISRRRTLQALALGALAPCFSAVSRAAAGGGLPVESALGGLEFSRGGRLGVTLLDASTGDHVGWRASERFGLCSTFKLPLAGLVLREVDRGALQLDQFVPYGP